VKAEDKMVSIGDRIRKWAALADEHKAANVAREEAAHRCLLASDALRSLLKSEGWIQPGITERHVEVDGQVFRIEWLADAQVRISRIEVER
jgi:hypothetical protein